MRDDDLKKRYGITSEQYEEIFESQGRKCAICRRSDTGVKNQKWFHVDHSHSKRTSRVRGIICKDCNTGLGMFKDTPELLLAAASYLFRSEEFEDES